MAQIDVDDYKTIKDCCKFIYPKLAPGGIMAFEDFPGQDNSKLKIALKEFFSDKAESPIFIPSGMWLLLKI